MSREAAALVVPNAEENDRHGELLKEIRDLRHTTQNLTALVTKLCKSQDETKRTMKHNMAVQEKAGTTIIDLLARMSD